MLVKVGIWAVELNSGKWLANITVGLTGTTARTRILTMRRHQSLFTPGLRLLAAATHVIWLAALTASTACGPLDIGIKKEATATCSASDACAKGNLDSQNAEATLEIFRELNASGLTVLMVTHNADLARQAKRIVTSRDGCLLG